MCIEHASISLGKAGGRQGKKCIDKVNKRTSRSFTEKVDMVRKRDMDGPGQMIRCASTRRPHPLMRMMIMMMINEMFMVE